NTGGQGSPPWERGSMRHRATQLILPFEPASPGRQLILAPRLWPAMTSRRQQLAKRLAHLLRSVLIADGREMSGGPGDEHAAQSGKSGNDGASRQTGLYLRATVDCRSSPPASGEHGAAVPAGRSSSCVWLAEGTD